jgi:hypothetical protein
LTPKRPKRKKAQHEKFVELARQVGADESEQAFVGKLRRVLAAPKPKSSKKKGR